MAKELTWDDVATGFDPAEEAAQKQAAPHRGIGTKAYERFWGTDVDEDPLELIRLGSQLTGGIGGAVTGAKLGAMAGTAVAPGMGTAVGAGLGAMAGGFAGGMAGTVAPEYGIEAAEFLGVASEGTRDKIGLTDDELSTVMEGEAILDMITGGGLIAARGGVRTATRAFVGMGLIRRPKTVRDSVEFAAEHGVNMLPVQVGKRTVPRGFVSVLGKFPLVAGPIKRSIIEREKEIKGAFENLPANIAPVATLNEVSHEVFMDAKQLVTRTSQEMKKRFDDVYTQADHAGATVLPTNTTASVQSVIAQIAKETPNAARTGAKSKKATPTAVMDDVKNFLANDIAVIFKKHRAGSVTVAPQSYRQMDTVLDKIDEKIGALGRKEGALAEEAVSRLQRVRQAVATDIYTQGQGEFAKDISADLKALDEDYTGKITDIFQTTAAKKFGTVRRGGLSHLEMADVPTKVSMDNLTDILMKGTDVKELEEVGRLVQPETFKKMAAYSIGKQVEGAFADNGKTLDLPTLSKSLGLDKPKSSRYAHTKKMLEMSGGLSMNDLNKLVDIGEKIGKVEAPEASTFIARRGVMSGMEGIVKGMLPTLTVGGSAASATGSYGAGVLATMFFAGGSHMVGRAIVDPRIARPVAKVLDKEARSIVKKGAALQAGRLLSNYMIEDGEFSISEALDWRKNYEKMINLFDRNFKQQENLQKHRVPTSE